MIGWKFLLEVWSDELPEIGWKFLLEVWSDELPELLNPLIATLQPQSNGPSYSNTVIGTLAVDVCTGCYIW